MTTILALAAAMFYSPSAQAYPEFIGYKYASCLTCHYNSHGNGPLNDYGRALWSAEIAGRLFAGSMSDEQLGESSGFLGSKPLPWWIRPGIKARGLSMQTNPGGSGSETRWILMQADANLAIFLDQNQKYTFVGSYGYAPKPQRYSGVENSPEISTWISREHYFRWQAMESLFVYIGFMDKVFGIRTVDHTAYSRARTGLAQNDQSHGMTVHYIQPKWELTLNQFIGNLNQDAKLRQKGGSLLFEYEVDDAWRVGFSTLVSSNDFVDQRRSAIHSRVGFGWGSAVLFEMGVIEDLAKSKNRKFGYYGYGEMIQKVVRGYHAFFTGQAYKERVDTDKPDTFKVSAGVLAFPMARLELRFELENTWLRSWTSEVQRDNWLLLSQAHLSL